MTTGWQYNTLYQSTLCGGSGRPVALHTSCIAAPRSTYSVPETWTPAQSNTIQSALET